MTETNLLTYQQAADFLGIRLTTLYSKVSRREVPHVRLSGRMVRFDREALAQWLGACAVPVKAAGGGVA